MMAVDASPDSPAAPPSRIFFGRWIVAACSLVQGLQNALLQQAYGGYVVLLGQEFRWSKGILSWGSTEQQAVYGATGPGVGWLVLLALMSQVLGYPLINASIPHLPSVVGSLLLFVQPLMTLVAGVLIFGEIPTPGQLVGALILFGGVLVAARK